ncbi:hypothetical protein [Tahibacter caeni]|uniref:hypothetical protein n=1 Tax=Tahibacter caeni TaxID=1453545 RepID=UPI0021472606|nr:hypothetical protein [Tahibacter caeni]
MNEMPAKATYDRETVDAWSRCVASFREARRWRWRALSIAAAAAPLPALLGLIAALPYLPAVGFLLLATAALTRFGHAAQLTCPHCGLVPAGAFERLPLHELDYCRHCHFWLVDPRRGVAPR